MKITHPLFTFFKILIFAAIIVVLFNFVGNKTHAQEATSAAASPVGGVTAEGDSLITRLAPGEDLPFSVKLVNFGSSRRVDVTITYDVRTLSGRIICSEGETVAVDTTASFVKKINIPDDTPAGRYVAEASISYDYQEVPATAKFEFTVEPKIFGFFRSDFILYAVVTILLTIAALAVAEIMRRKWTHPAHAQTFDYSKKPKDKRIYYEIISQAIAEMRLHAGDDALTIASSIPDLMIDPETGEVLSVKDDPSKILSLLVLRYETLLGRKVSPDARLKRKEQ